MRSLNAIFVVTAWVAFISMMTCLIFDAMKGCASAQYDEDTALALVQCLRAECETCTRDPEEPAAIAWILKKGAIAKGIDFRDQIHEYCAMFNRHNDRARSIADSTFDDPKRGSKRWWSKMHRWARRFLLGYIPDPERESKHFGCDGDTRRMQGRILLRSFCSKVGCTHIWGRKV